MVRCIIPFIRFGGRGEYNLKNLDVVDYSGTNGTNNQPRATIKTIEYVNETQSNGIVKNDELSEEIKNDEFNEEKIVFRKLKKKDDRKKTKSSSSSSDSEKNDSNKPDLRPVSYFIQTGPTKTSKDKMARKEGILSTMNIDTSKPVTDLEYAKYEKDERNQKLIKDAMNANDFIKNLMDKDRLNAVVEAMSPKEFTENSYIIREGESGSHLYVSAEGKFEVVKGDKVVKKFGPGEAFGELAVLYKAKRFASVRVTSNAKVWVLERRVFQKIMIRSDKQEQEDNLKFLSSVTILEGIQYVDLVKISDFLKREFFSAGTMIVRQGERGDKFYIIRGGNVVLTKRPPDGGPDEFIKELTRGDYFGEQALLKEDRRLATATAKAPGVECLTIERGPFNEFLGNIEELRKATYTTETRVSVSKKQPQIPAEYENIKFEDLEVIGTLGVGGFGRVELVRNSKNKNQTFALKCLKKVDIVHQQQQGHVFNEKHIMFDCQNPFICRLFRTYKDSKYLYFLMEPLLGGDVWTVLHKKRNFNNLTARFMTACVIEAYDYLHRHNIIYRDLKPENLMLDSQGYIKLVDFGYAKYLSMGLKSYTFAGTPEYVAPEIVLNRGHDKAVDYWALGIFVHELLVGKPPFRGANPMRTYNLILKGIDAVEFNPKITKTAQVLIRKLCRPVPTERLGYLKNGIKDIKNHKWFLGFDWDKLKDRKMQAPLVRPITSNTDLQNFPEKYPREQKLPPDETSGWDDDF